MQEIKRGKGGQRQQGAAISCILRANYYSKNFDVATLLVLTPNVSLKKSRFHCTVLVYPMQIDLDTLSVRCVRRPERLINELAIIPPLISSPLGPVSRSFYTCP